MEAIYTDDKLDGICNGCVIEIRPTTKNFYRVQVYKNDVLLARSLEPTIELAHTFAEFIAKTRADRA